jgi:hypothetical protein
VTPADRHSIAHRGRPVHVNLDLSRVVAASGVMTHELVLAVGVAAFATLAVGASLTEFLAANRDGEGGT